MRVESLAGGMVGRWQKVKTFVCSYNRIKPVYGDLWREKEHVFNGIVSSLSSAKLMSTGLRNANFSVALSSCRSEGGGTVATCDLKLTTGSDLDWSTKVSAKAKFTISQ